MHDIKAIRQDPAAFDKAMKRRKLEPQSPKILELDEARRAVQTELQTLQNTRNAKSKEIGSLKAKKDEEGANALMAEVNAIKDSMTALEEKEASLAAQLHEILSSLPNVQALDIPDGADEEGNVEIRKVGEPKKQNSESPDHVAIGEGLGMMDFETAAKMSGSRFVVLSAGIARLERALAQFMLDTHTQEHGYTEVSPPLMVNSQAMYGTGQLPKFGEDLYECIGEFRKAQRQYLVDHVINEERGSANNLLGKINKALGQGMQKAKADGINVGWLVPIFDMFSVIFDSFHENFEKFSNKFQKFQEEFEDMDKRKVGQVWLIPTSEVSLTNIVSEQIIDEETLPRRYTAHTPCFRSEAGAAGKDTKGMIRQHQFYKVEMVSITKPEDSEAEHQRMTQCAENILKKLELPFRTIVLCTGDASFSSYKTYDIEVWLPGQNRYREISSCSNCWDFQARRMNARCRVRGEKETKFVHTLNGSGLAVGRTLIAVLENYYDPADGGVFVPKALQPYMGGLTKITKAG